ncbi:sphingosine hydroxylase [Laetiporus sulphureus 93-53]|uniref:Sphingosine hydroxylase n=1 Tax=Laetiporus sulphureus 93-53 TaxID=1314785 RepID=A0A165G5U4_9APHY|nr:sphingosine hydroxylase [Laetiporus sulphureus 93-53]KZT09866.1 sphingosine hydroxylase [Laetiporus sulphureus 93-53]
MHGYLHTTVNVTQEPFTLSPSQMQYVSTTQPFYYSPRANLVDWMPDRYFALAVPVVAYWLSSLTFHMMDTSDWKWLEKYRIHDSAEVKTRNLVTRWQVIKAVLLQQVVQTIIGIFWMEETVSGAGVDHVGNMLRLGPSLARVLTWTVGEKTGGRLLDTDGGVLLYYLYWWALPAARFIFGMFIIDTWQYFLHRAMHMNSWLYKQFHSVHHRLYVPYAFGALYNHPLEGLLLDTLSGGLAELISGMTTREAIVLFAVSTLKTVDDHCGYKMPFDPLQVITSNNADYHDIHHQASLLPNARSSALMFYVQVIGIKSNFAQPFFVHWDTILRTRMTRKDIEMRRQQQKKSL